MHATPAAANRSLPVLSVILRQAELHGHRPEGSNPCTGLRRFRQPGRERFLTADEIRRLGAELAAREAAAPLPAAAIRLLLLTGCRQSEIRTLCWRDYRAGHLFLSDSKTGPRTVWLSSAGRRVLDRLPRTSRWVFPAPGGADPLSAETLYGCWRPLRAAAGLPGLRLHDLRQLRARAGRDGADHRPPAGTPRPGHHPALHPLRRRDGACSGRGRRRGPGRLTMAAPTLRDFAGSCWKTTCYDCCKPSTRRRIDSALRTQILPTFGAQPLGTPSRATP